MHFELRGDGILEGLALLGGAVPLVAFEMAIPIVQTRAVMAAARLGVFEALVDGMLLVVEDDVTEERDYRRALQSLNGGKLIGTVLNRVPSV